MSNIQSDESLDDLPQVMDFLWREWRREIHTALPGMVRRYSQNNRRADVQPQVRTVLTDFTAVSRPIITDVPVVSPTAGGVVTYLPLRPGDNVLLVFAMRDIAEFKETYKESTPLGGILELGNAIAIPGFGPLEMSPVDSEAYCIQTENGETYIRLKGDMIEAKRGSQFIRLDNSNARVEASGTVTIEAGGSVRVQSGGSITLDSSGDTLIVR